MHFIKNIFTSSRFFNPDHHHFG